VEFENHRTPASPPRQHDTLPVVRGQFETALGYHRRDGAHRLVGLVDGEHVEFGLAGNVRCGATDVEDTEQPVSGGGLDSLSLPLVLVRPRRVGFEPNRLSWVYTPDRAATHTKNL
jgi:hypothetical protein